MNRLLNKIKVKAILPAAAFLAAAAIGTTFAWQKWDLDITNELRSHTTAVSVDEEFDENDPFDHKKVKFKNEGSSSVFLRVSYTEYWQKGDYILSNQVGDEIVAVKIGPGNKNDWSNRDGWPDINDWQLIDGWYYYKKVLKKGESTSEILSRVVIPENFAEKFPEYVGAQYHLYFKVEAVQCSDGNNTLNSGAVNADATQKMFGKTATVDSAGNVTWN